MSAVTRAPTRLSSWVSVTAALLSLAASGFYSWAALGVGTLGLVLLAAGLVRGATAAVTGGAFGLFLGAITAGVQHAPVAAVLVGVTAAVIAWDCGGYAIGLGSQLGREPNTRRVEAVHATASVAVGAVTTGAGYGLYRAGPGEQPLAALVFLLVAAVFLLVALD